MQLITEADLKILGAPAPSISGVSSISLEEPVAASALLAFLTLSQSPELFVEAGWSHESIFWSRYFWFRRFINLRTVAAGSDAGLEQQALQILESPLPSCSPDWSKLELIELTASVK